MSVAPTLDNRMYALFVTVWFAVKAAEVTVTFSSKVTVISKLAASAYSPSVQSIDITFAPCNVDVPNPRIHTSISG